MSKSGLLVALLGVGIGLTGMVHSADEPKAADADFKKLDVDKDGAIGREEAARMQGLPELFDAADANKDGKLDPSEFSRAAATLKKQSALHLGSPGGPCSRSFEYEGPLPAQVAADRPIPISELNCIGDRSAVPVRLLPS